MKLKKYQNIKLLISILTLNVISLLNMINAKVISRNYNNYFNKQLIWFILGYIFVILLLKINKKLLFKYSKYFYLLSILLLILVLFIGKEINGAKCWLSFMGISFQPSELCKLSLSLYLSYIVNNTKIKSLKDKYILIVKVFTLTIIPSILVFLEPDTGAIIYFIIIMIIVLIYIKLNKWCYIIGFLLCFLLLTLLFLNYFFNQDLLIKLLGNSLFYRMDRIINFANGNSYQLENALITIGCTSFLGIGINKILLYIPEATTDFFFAFSLGNYGILSAILIIISLYMIDSYLLNSLFFVKNNNRLFILTYIGIFIFQQIYNLFMNIGLLPIMGIPLPFLSYGGSNILINYIYLGIILNMIKTK